MPLKDSAETVDRAKRLANRKLDMAVNEQMAVAATSKEKVEGDGTDPADTGPKLSGGGCQCHCVGRAGRLKGDRAGWWYRE